MSSIVFNNSKITSSNILLTLPVMMSFKVIVDWILKVEQFLYILFVT